MKKFNKILPLALCIIMLACIMTSCESKEEKAQNYIKELTEYSNEYSGAMSEFNKEWQKANFEDAKWRETVIEKIEKVDTFTDKLSGLSAPEEYSAAQEKVKSGTAKIKTAMTSFKEIVEKSKSASDAIKYQEDIIKNINLLSEASDAFNEANNLVQTQDSK